MDTTSLLEGLTEDQVEAVTTDAAPLCILAGAGSGKTRVLTRRIAHRIATGSADPRHVLALTFTRKAAGELNSRLRALGVRDTVAAGTFHSIAFAQLRRRWADAGRTAPVLLERKGRLLGSLIRSGGLGDASLQVSDVATEIEWAKARMISPEAYEAAAADARRRAPLSLADMATLYRRYEDEKRSRHAIDFDDLLVLCARALDTDELFAQTQRWRFRHLFVDEFQDVNPVQHQLLQGWLGDRADLCVVGDPNQAIYGWNGADARYLTDFVEQRPAATIIRLEDSFRSSPQVLAVAHAVLGSGNRRCRPLRPHRADGAIPTVRSFASDVEEARGIARAIRDRRRPGMPWSHLAVLTRTHGQHVLLEEALRDAGVPFRLRGGDSFLRRSDVRAALTELETTGGPLAARLTDLEVAARQRPGDPIETADVDIPRGDELAFEPSDEPDDRRSALEELVRLGQQHLAIEPAATAGSFVSWLHAVLGTEGHQDRGDAVEVATFHAAKGLEWPIVFLAGLEQGLVPIGGAGDGSAADEERRLLYVAITRAETELHCSWARKRTFGSRSVPRRPSPWLEDVEAARAALTGGSTSVAPDWRDRLVEERRRLRTVRPLEGSPRGPGVTVGLGADPEVLAALKAWRGDAARTVGVPANVILHDTTLAAIAEAVPEDRESLMALPGMGPVKAERYGDALLSVVANHSKAAAS